MKPVVITGPSANTGKTELCCRLLRAFAGTQALKITRFHRESHCPVHGAHEHADDACDGCDPAPFGFELVTDQARLRTPGKDTDRFAQAGASAVLWLRAAPHVFEYALSAALKQLDMTRPLLIEGNSAAAVSALDAKVVVIWPQVTRGVKASVYPALKRCHHLVLVEAGEEPRRRWPPTLRQTCERLGLPQSRLPEPLWLGAQWWREQGALPELAQALQVELGQGLAFEATGP